MFCQDSTNSAKFFASGALATFNLFLGHCYMILQIISLLLAIASFVIGLRNEIQKFKKRNREK
jgi:hypothetical protein